MKTKNAVLTMVVMMVASIFSFAANPTSKVAILNQSNSVYKLIYEGATAGKVTLKIYDNKGQVIFTEIKKGLSKFILPLNFADLEQGEYSIEITDETGTQTQKVIHTIETAEEATTSLAHITKLQGGRYLVSTPTSGSISIQVFDGNNNLVHSKNFESNGGLAIVYNLKNVDGQASIQVK